MTYAFDPPETTYEGQGVSWNETGLLIGFQYVRSDVYPYYTQVSLFK